MDRARLKKGRIGFFDSGVGLLPIWKQCRTAMPNEDYLALADVARFSFGGKDSETLVRYALTATEALRAENLKAVVFACNTICAHALEKVRQEHPDQICVGVIDSAVEDAVEKSPTGKIAVLSTQSTADSGAFPSTIKRRAPGAQVQVLGAGVLVSLAEQGWTDGPEVDAVVGRYLSQLHDFDTLILGCTHYGLLERAIRQRLGPAVNIVNSARATALALRRQLEITGLLNDQPSPGKTRFWVTDTPRCFQRIMRTFLGDEDELPDVEHIDIPGYAIRRAFDSTHSNLIA